MKIVCVITARMGSTRLRGKAMMSILGKPMLEHVVERTQRSRLIDEIVVATTTNQEDDVIVELAKKLGVGIYRGSSEDVLNRTLKAAKSVNGDTIVQINGDCPLIDPKLTDALIQSYLEIKPDYATNSRLKRTFPLGLDVEVFSTKSLEQIEKTIKDPSVREHVTLYYYEHPEKYKILSIEAPPELDRPDLRLTVDTEEDLQLVREIYRKLYEKDPSFTTKQIIELIDRKPHLKEINVQVRQKKARE